MDFSNYRKKMRRERHQKVGVYLAIIVVFATSIFTEMLAISLVGRSQEVASYYFNESKVTTKIKTQLTASQMAESITGYINSFNSEPYTLVEKNGNNEKNTFSKNDGYNLLKAKKGLDIALAIGLICFATIIIVYIYLMKRERRKALRDMALISIPFTVGLTIVNAIAIMTDSGRVFLRKMLSMRVLSDTSNMNIILGKNYMQYAGKVFIIVSLAIMIITCLIMRRIAREKKVFRYGNRYAAR